MRKRGTRVRGGGEEGRRGGGEEGRRGGGEEGRRGGGEEGRGRRGGVEEWRSGRRAERKEEIPNGIAPRNKNRASNPKNI